jgi:hypothetical protein
MRSGRKARAKLGVRRKAFDALSREQKDARKRPGSLNAKKQA